jgi:hypothetical protein
MNNNWRNSTLVELNTELAFVIQENDPVAAKNLINYFHERFNDIGLDGCPKNDIGVLCQYMEYVFEKIVVESWNADQALGLKRRRGKYKRAETETRDYELAACMILLVRKGKKWLEAKGETANQFFEDGKGEKAVEAAYSNHKHLFTLFSDEQLEEIIKGALRS